MEKFIIFIVWTALVWFIGNLISGQPNPHNWVVGGQIVGFFIWSMASIYIASIKVENE